MKEYSQCLLYCSISEHSTYSCRQETAKVVREVPTNQSLQTTMTNQLHYLCSSVTTAHFHHMGQTGSLFKPHPLLPHGNACYYSGIILNSLPLPLFSELFRHIYLRPTPIGLSNDGRKQLSNCVNVLFITHVYDSAQDQQK